MKELIEQKVTSLTVVGGSKYINVPLSWREKLGLADDTKIVVRLCKGKKGLFIDIFKESNTTT